MISAACPFFSCSYQHRFCTEAARQRPFTLSILGACISDVADENIPYCFVTSVEHDDR